MDQSWISSIRTRTYTIYFGVVVFRLNKLYNDYHVKKKKTAQYNDIKIKQI